MTYIGLLDPKTNIWLVAYSAAAIAFFSASQDVVLDAYRRELLPDEELGLGNSMYVNGYRVAGFIPGGLGLILSDYLSWSTTFFIVSCFMLVGILMTLLIGETSDSKDAPTDFKDAVIRPFTEFFQREGGARQALLILAFMFLYKIGDNMATALSTPFYSTLASLKPS